MHSIIFKQNFRDSMQIPLPNSKIAYEMNARWRAKCVRNEDGGGGDWMSVEEKWYCNQLHCMYEAKLNSETHTKMQKLSNEAHKKL